MKPSTMQHSHLPLIGSNAKRYLTRAPICLLLSIALAACGGGGSGSVSDSGSGGGGGGGGGSGGGGGTGSTPPTTLSCTGYPKTVGNFAQVCIIVQESAQVTPSLAVTTITGDLTGHGQDNLQSFVVYARIVAQDTNQGAATALAKSVVINTANGKVSATPDQVPYPQSLTIDFEVFTAQTTNLTLTSTTGDLAVDNYNAILNLKTTTGDAGLNAVQGQETVNITTGDIKATFSGPSQGQETFNTTTGDIKVTFAGTSFTGTGMTAKATTGDITVSRPVGFQAAFTAKTHSGTAAIDGQQQTAPVPVTPAVVTSGTGAPIQLETITGDVSVTH